MPRFYHHGSMLFLTSFIYFITVISPATYIFNRNCYQINTFSYYSVLFYTSMWTPFILIYILLFLTIFYVYQIPERNTYGLSFRNDYYVYCFVMTIYTLHEIRGTLGRTSMCGNSVLKEAMKNPTWKFMSQWNIRVAYDNYKDLERDKRRYQKTYKNIHFHYLPELKILRRKKRVNAQPITDQNTRECVPYQGLKPSSLKNGFPVKNIAEIDQNYICSSCKLILREPYRLKCDHRLCQSCINPQNTTINCLTCAEISVNNDISFDKSFKDEIECLSIICTVCDWTGKLKVYQEHFDQNHFDHFTTCSLCSKQVERSKIHEHYLSITHQQLLPNILLQLQSIKEKIVFSQLNDRISSLSNDVIMVQSHLQQIDLHRRSYEPSLQVVARDLPLLRMLSEDNDNYLSKITSIQANLTEDIDLIKECLEGGHIISFDGIFLWKITDIQQRFYDARSERQRSIYSPEFYSSPFGYKMRSRLFLDGANLATRGYLSIYFLLMRGDYDALLEWPFCFKVTFSLLDPSTAGSNRNHWSQSFWSDRDSICFQRPRLAMNELYGFEKFISIEQFQQNQNRYVQDDTIFFKIEVDFQNKSPTLPSNSANMLINDEQHTDTNEDDILRRFFSFDRQIQ